MKPFLVRLWEAFAPPALAPAVVPPAPKPHQVDVTAILARLNSLQNLANSHYEADVAQTLGALRVKLIALVEEVAPNASGKLVEQLNNLLDGIKVENGFIATHDLEALKAALDDMVKLLIAARQSLEGPAPFDYETVTK